MSDLSGRGVGMDVVLHGVEQLGGFLDIATTPECGTRFRLVIPLQAR